MTYDPAAPQQAPPPKKSSTTRIVILVVVAILLLALLCCGGIGAAVYFGMGMAGEQVAGHPAVVEQFGENAEASMNLTATAEVQQEQAPGENLMVFDVEGPEGSGQVVVRQEPGGGGFEIVRIILSDGTEIPVEAQGEVMEQTEPVEQSEAVEPVE